MGFKTQETQHKKHVIELAKLPDIFLALSTMQNWVQYI